MGMHLLVGIGELDNYMHTLSLQEEKARGLNFWCSILDTLLRLIILYL
jgi:hypothetical protein